VISRGWTKGGKRGGRQQRHARQGQKSETEPVPVPPPDRGGEVIVVGAPQQGPDTSFIAYRQAIEIAEAARQRAIAAALADYRRALEDIETAYRRELAAARCRYSQGTTGQRAAQAVA
jgi:alpha-ketoglutarate-dependent taurine dioxygenase